MITIYLNNDAYQIKPDYSLQAFLQSHYPTNGHFAVAINNHIVPRALYDSTCLHESDHIDVIAPMQGG